MTAKIMCYNVADVLQSSTEVPIEEGPNSGEMLYKEVSKIVDSKPKRVVVKINKITEKEWRRHN